MRSNLYAILSGENPQEMMTLDSPIGEDAVKIVRRVSQNIWRGTSFTVSPAGTSLDGMKRLVNPTVLPLAPFCVF